MVHENKTSRCGRDKGARFQIPGWLELTLRSKERDINFREAMA